MARGRASSGVSGGAAAGALRASPTRSLRRSGHPVREYILLTCLRWELSSGGERPSATRGRPSGPPRAPPLTREHQRTWRQAVGGWPILGPDWQEGVLQRALSRRQARAEHVRLWRRLSESRPAHPPCLGMSCFVMSRTLRAVRCRVVRLAGALRASPTRSLRRSGHPVREYILLTCLRWELSSGGERPSATRGRPSGPPRAPPLTREHQRTWRQAVGGWPILGPDWQEGVLQRALSRRQARAEHVRLWRRLSESRAGCRRSVDRRRVRPCDAQLVTHARGRGPARTVAAMARQCHLGLVLACCPCSASSRLLRRRRARRAHRMPLPPSSPPRARNGSYERGTGFRSRLRAFSRRLLQPPKGARRVRARR